MHDGRVRIFLAGEGKTDIGNAAAIPPYNTPEQKGIVQTLLDRIAPDAWESVGAVHWKNIRTYRAGEHRRAEERNVRGLALMARDAGADAVAFVRDRDGDLDRKQDIDAGISQVRDIRVAGGVAIEAVEAWVLAALGDSRAHHHPHPKYHLAREFGVRTAAEKADVLATRDLTGLEERAPSLEEWLRRARRALASAR